MVGESELQRVETLAAALSMALGSPPEWACVLGSGLSQSLATLPVVASIDFAELPHLPKPSVAGHGAQVRALACEAQTLWVASGRVHAYEGHSPAAVVRLVRAFALLGLRKLLLTNAAGGLAKSLAPGTWVVLSDHLNLSGLSPFEGPHEPRFGPRFPDASQIYDQELQAQLKGALGETAVSGVYAGLRGPSYETPAEVRMLGRLGADTVGMSTVLEAGAAHAMGLRVAGLSLVSNPGAGLHDQPLAHEEVLEAGRRAATTLGQAIPQLVGRGSDGPSA